MTSEDEVTQAVKSIKSHPGAVPENDSSQLGTAVRQVLNDFRGSSLAAVVMMTDGVTTEGEDLAGVSKYAAQMGVPLYFVGVGDAHEVRDVYLHDLQAEDSVYVNDRIIFEVRLTAQGYTNLTLPIRLFEKGKEREDQALDKKTVTITPDNRTVKVRLMHQPTEPGEKVYVIKVPPQEGEIDKDNNVLEKTIYVREAKQIKVLYVEGYRRYEYHYVKMLLERESGRLKGNKSINLRVLLLDADKDWEKLDKSAEGLKGFPMPFRDVDVHTKDDDLWSYDVVILGDINPDAGGNDRITEHLKNLADFVRERGGGLLVIAGERFSPRAYRNSPLKDVLPIDLTREKEDGDSDNEILEGYRPELTTVGRMHPIFRFVPDEKENDEIWGKLKEFFWYADGYEPSAPPRSWRPIRPPRQAAREAASIRWCCSSSAAQAGACSSASTRRGDGTGARTNCTSTSSGCRPCVIWRGANSAGSTCDWIDKRPIVAASRSRSRCASPTTNGRRRTTRR